MQNMAEEALGIRAAVVAERRAVSRMAGDATDTGPPELFAGKRSTCCAGPASAVRS